MSWLDTLIFGYRNVQVGGVSLPAENTFNLVGAVTAVDNPGLGRTDITFTALSAPTGSGLVHVTGGTVDGTGYKGAAGQMLVTNAGGTDTAWVTMSQDATITGAGVLSVVQLTGNAGIVNTPNIATWKLTSLRSEIGDVLTISSGLVQLGNAATLSNFWVRALTSVYLNNAGGNGNIQLACNGGGGSANIYLDADNQVVRTGAGTEVFRFVPGDPSFRFDSASGTFPATGFLRFKNYASKTMAIAYRHAGGDGPLLQIDGANQYIYLGNETVTVGSTLFLQGYYGVNIQTVAGAFNISTLTGANAISIKNFNNNTPNITLDVGTLAGACNLRFGEGIVATIKQDIASTNVNGTTFSISAQAAKSGGGGNGGALAFASGAKDGAGTDGPITFSTGATQQVSITANTWTFVGSTSLTSAGNLTLGTTSIGYTVFPGSGAVNCVFSSATGYASFGTGAQDAFRIHSTNAGATDITWDPACTSITLSQSNLGTNSGTGASLTIQAQNETGTTSTGGILALKPGTGTTVDGQLQMGTSKSTAVLTGAFRNTTRSLAGNLTVDTTTTDYEILVDTTGARTITLPPPTNGRKLLIKDVTGNAGTNNITIARNSSEKIEGVAASYLITNNWGWAFITSNGTDWFLYR